MSLPEELPGGELGVAPIDRAGCEALLEARDMGRMAFSFRDQIDIQPLEYAFREGWIFGRTSPGTKVEVLRHNRWVAFQVDEIQGRWEWRSVIARGPVHFFDPERGGEDARMYALALAALRQAFPETLTPSDPTPRRCILFGIFIQELKGIAASLHQGPAA